MTSQQSLGSMALSQATITCRVNTLRPGYCVIIRTFNSARTLPATLASLAGQSLKPTSIVVVDSGSTDNTISLLPRDTIVHRYAGECFNYSEAINQGLPYIETEFVAIVSSHTVLDCPRAFEYATQLLTEDLRLGGAYFSTEEPPKLEHVLIDRERFTGFNGISNAATLLRTVLVRSRPFRPEVFSCEDSEWSRWLLEERDMIIARIDGSRKRNLNPRQRSLLKYSNELFAIALFVKPDMFRWRGIVLIGLGAFKPSRGRSLFWRIVMMVTFYRLILAHFVKPSPSSRYY